MQEHVQVAHKKVPFAASLVNVDVRSKQVEV